MQVFDASSMIYAWDNYPCDQFPKLWAWMADRVAQGLIQVSEVAEEEIRHKIPECAAWLQDAGLRGIPVSEEVLFEALRIKGLLGIDEDKYGTGVDENDLLIIATARLWNCELVTDEAFQPSANKLKKNWKIPAVCNMETVQVNWTGFVEYLKRTKVVFG